MIKSHKTHGSVLGLDTDQGPDTHDRGKTDDSCERLSSVREAERQQVSSRRDVLATHG